jgi:hypothetical protein
MIYAGDAKQTNKPKRHTFGSLFVTLSLFLSVFFIGMTTIVRPALASCCGCSSGDVEAAKSFIEDAHEGNDELIDHTQTEWDDDLEAYENWLINTFLNEEVAVAAAMMVTQMSAVAMQYTQIIGAFLDAQTQLDTQRVLRNLQYEAHRDYVPSETFCHFGTNVRSLAATEDRGRYNALALSRISLARQMGTVNVAGSDTSVADHRSRWKQFVDTYCDPLDNNFQDVSGVGNPLNVPASEPRTGLLLACDHDGSGSGLDIGARDENRFNRDINYTRLIEKPRTLEMKLSDSTINSTITPASTLYVAPINQPGDEEDVIAMSKNLYGHNVLSRSVTSTLLTRFDAKRVYLALRSVAARRNVAQASYNAIVALKSAGTTHEMIGNETRAGVGSGADTAFVLDDKQTRRYMGAIIKQLLPADPAATAANIFSLIGYSPSYFAQLEVLSKRIYQDPSFYSNLYETPANVARKRVAMKAIELMVDRAIYESQIRREMGVSVLLSSKLRALHRDANKGLAMASGQDK